MKQEIERKFLVRSDAWRASVSDAQPIQQGYLSLDPARIVRVRRSGDAAWLTIKGNSDGPARAEFECAIPVEDALELLRHFCLPNRIEKTRHRIQHGTLTFEVDVFGGENQGLILAELELPARDTPVELPAWIGREVTGDARYFNAYLCRHPYRTWPRE